ncbi:MAG: PQQ-dependent sugar dehydrogenase [Chloroflexota bacterium]
MQSVVGSTIRLGLTVLPLLLGTAAAQMDGERGDIGAELVVEGLVSPLALESPPDGSGDRFIVDQTGTIHVLTAEGELSDQPFLNIGDRLVDLIDGFEERGLLGLAFHPEYAENGRFFVHYSAPLRAEAPGGWDHTSRISEFRVPAEDSRRADPESERVLLEVDQVNRKTNGGALAFGPDGYLYISMGEGGGAHGIGEVVHGALEVPEAMNVWDFLAQDVTTLYGKILRIDVDRGWPGYAVPQDNPFVGREGRDEIWAWGFRNHYRMAFDQGGNRQLFVAAVSEALWEAVYLVDQPGNYGWPIREASHCYDRQSPLDPPEECPTQGPNGWRIHGPVVEYGNLNLLESPLDVEPAGTAVVGAHVYRGDLIPDLRGKLVFADYSGNPETPSGQVFAAAPATEVGEMWPWQKLLEVDARIQSMGQDADGELYLLTREAFAPSGDTGKVFRLLQAPAGTDSTSEGEGSSSAGQDDAGGDAQPGSGEADASQPDERAGWYTEEQAERGLADYREHCQECHGRDMLGEDPFPPITGSRFMRRWEGRTAWGLFDYISSQMPLGRPASLEEQTYVDILAHWLRFHEYPKGENELGADEELLEQIVIEPQGQ